MWAAPTLLTREKTVLIALYDEEAASAMNEPLFHLEAPLESIQHMKKVVHPLFDTLF